MRDEPFDAYGEDGFVVSRQTFYAALYPRLRQVAREHGYALPLHGSLQKDLDVVAVPWVEDASDIEELVDALVEAAGGVLTHGPLVCPHGRKAFTIELCRYGAGDCPPPGYIDLSVVPQAASASS